MFCNTFWRSLGFSAIAAVTFVPFSMLARPLVGAAALSLYLIGAVVLYVAGMAPSLRAGVRVGALASVLGVGLWLASPGLMVTAFGIGVITPRWLYVLGDMEVALEAAVGGGCGVVLLAGTGSIAYGRNGKGEVARAGGEGPAVGDEGSGYAIGRAAVEVVLQAGKGRAPETRLTSPLCDALRVSRPEELSQRLSPANAAELAALLPVVVEATRAGDATAREILRQAGEALAGVAVKVLQQLDLLTGDVRLATSGGVFAASEEVFNRVRTVIARVAPRVRVERLVVSPAEGALRLGQRLWLEESAGGRK